MTLAERLRLLCSLVPGLSLRELAGLIGVSPAYPSLIASGARPNIRTDIAANLARVFGTTTDFVVSGIGDPPSAEHALAAVEEARAAKSAPPASEPKPNGAKSEAS